MRRVWQVANSSSEYVLDRLEPSVGVVEGTRVVDEEVEVAEAAEASKVDGTADGCLSVDNEGER